jgi:lipid A 4'-phosphatase
MSRLTLSISISFILCAILFSLYPQLDLNVSAAFFSPDHGFVGDQNAVILAIYRGVPLMSRAIIIGLLIAMFAYAMQRGGAGRRRRIQVGYLIAALAIGPGLLIDVGLKDHWGRARPAKVTEFGGTQTFSAALQPTDQCGTNCSFVSGHASAGFYIVSLGFLGGAAARRRWTLIGLATGALFGFGRITQGGHFLSDIVFSFYATWFAAWATWLVFMKLGWLPEETKTAAAPETRTAV